MRNTVRGRQLEIEMIYELSVVIPLYNPGYGIKTLVSNLCNQSQQIEIILVDDCSANPISEALDQLSRQFKSVKVLRLEKNSGPGVARNRGIEAVTGKWVTFVDADDEVSTEFYKKAMAVLKEKNPDVLVFDYQIKSGKQIVVQRMIPGLPGGQISPEMALCHCKTATFGKIYRAGLVDVNQIRFGPMRIYEDAVFTKTALCFAESVYYFPEVLYTYVQVSDSLSRTQSSAVVESARVAVELIRKKCGNHHPHELEFVVVSEYLFSAAMNSRILGRGRLATIFNWVDENYPNWYQNEYMKSASRRYRFLAWAAHHRHYLWLYIYGHVDSLARRLLGVK